MESICPFSYNGNDILPFEQQYDIAAKSRVFNRDNLIVDKDSTLISPFCDNKLPLLISIFTIRKTIFNKHGKDSLNPAELREIRGLLSNGIVFAFESPNKDNSLALFTPVVGRNKMAIFVHKNAEVSRYVCNRIASIYEKDDPIPLIENALKGNYKFYINDKTKTWISQTGLQLPSELSMLIDYYSTFTNGRFTTFCKLDLPLLNINNPLDLSPPARLNERVIQAKQVEKEKPQPRNKDEPCKTM